MKILILVRHAKSDWEHGQHDKLRPLMARGADDALRIAAKAAEILPARYTIWSSTATRAATTARIFASAFKYPEKLIDYRDELYTFDETELEKAISSASDGVDCLMVFGHNEAITNFVNKFGDIFISNVPTSGFVMLNFDTNRWNNIKKAKTGTVLFPKEL